jgi:hypothetical protein
MTSTSTWTVPDIGSARALSAVPDQTPQGLASNTRSWRTSSDARSACSHAGTPYGAHRINPPSPEPRISQRHPGPEGCAQEGLLPSLQSRFTASLTRTTTMRRLLKNQKRDYFVLLHVPVHSRLCVNAFSSVPSLFVFALLCHVLSLLG